MSRRTVSRNLAKLQGGVALIRGGRLNNLGLPGRTSGRARTTLSSERSVYSTLRTVHLTLTLFSPSWRGVSARAGRWSPSGHALKMKQLYDRTNNIFRRASVSPPKCARDLPRRARFQGARRVKLDWGQARDRSPRERESLSMLK